MGLPIPWLLKNAIESSNDDWKGVPIRPQRTQRLSSAVVRSPYLMFYTCLLLGMVFGTVVSIMLSKWKLNKFLGAAWPCSTSASSSPACLSKS